MAFCPNCGAQVSGTFCPNCGTNVAAAQGAGTAGATGAGAAGTGPTGAGAAGAAYVPPGPPPIQAAGMSENVAGALCYLAGFITGIIFLVIAPYNQNKFVRFHAFQAIFAHVAMIVLWIAYAIVAGVLTFLTHGLGFFLYPLFGLLFFVLWIYLMYSAYNGKKLKLPVIGDLAERQA
jgi:uncharacterized membrane protein